MNHGMGLLARLDRLRGHPDDWDDRRRSLLRGDRVPPGRFGDVLVRPLVELVFGTPHRGVRVGELEVPGSRGPIGARVHRPMDLPVDAPLVVHLHGGGWTFGAPVHYDWWCSQVAMALGAVVVSLDYRLAPEHPAPAGVEDATSATAWLLDHAEEWFGATGPAAVMGDSAGANLATLVALDRRDAGDGRLRAQWLVCPIVDLTCSAPSIDRLADAPFLDRAELDATVDGYLGGMSADDPAVSPWFVYDVSGVAPAIVQVAEHDLLVDDGVRWAGRLADADVDVQLKRWVDQPHVFTLVPGVTRAARAALAEGVAFLTSRLAAKPPPASDTAHRTAPTGRQELHLPADGRSRHPDVPDEWIHGDVATGFGPVADTFVANFARGDEVGAALHVVMDGRPVVDLWGGHADRERTRAWKADTMVPVFSTTKGMVTMALAVAHSRGWLDFDQPVAAYWPEFAAADKAQITVRELLAHRAGLAVLDQPLDWDILGHPDELADRLAAQAPLWEPGTRQGYHAVTLGFYAAELLRRVDPSGRSVGAFFAHEIATPLGELDFHIGVPDDMPDQRLATFLDAPIAKGLAHLDDIEWRLIAGLMRPGSLTARSFGVMPIGAQEMGRINDRDILRLELPAFGGVGSARAVGTAYGEFAAGGRRLGLRPTTLAALAKPVPSPAGGNVDIVLGLDLVFALGFGRPSRAFVLGSSDRSYGFAGAGGSFGFADPDLSLGYGYVMNQMGFGSPTDPREVRLRDALYRCLGQRRQT